MNIQQSEQRKKGLEFSAQPTQQADVFAILSHAVRKNHYLNAYAGKAKFFEAWKQILDEALFKSYYALRCVVCGSVIMSVSVIIVIVIVIIVVRWKQILDEAL